MTNEMIRNMPGIAALRAKMTENLKKEAVMLHGIHKQEEAYDKFTDNLYQIVLNASEQEYEIRNHKIRNKLWLLSNDKEVCAELVMGIATLAVLTDLIHSISKIMHKANIANRDLTSLEKSVVSHELISLIEHEVVVSIIAEEGRSS